MRFICIIIFSFSFSIMLTGQDDKKVLIIGIDGCRPDALTIANTPNLDELISQGIYSEDALNDDITISGPGWSAILCGVWSDKHLVTGNNFDGNDYANFPSIFKYVDEVNPDLHTVSICHWAPINDHIIQDHADFKLNVSSDAELSDQATNYLSVNDPDLVFLHFDDVDHAGHNSGFSTTNTEYLAAIEGVDAYIAPILDAIEQRANYANEDWLILVTTDHGGIGTSHGGNSFAEENVFVVASGKNISTTTIKKDSAYVLDSPNCLGDSTSLKFDGQDDYVQIPANAIFDFGANQDFTIECRVKTNVSADVAIVGNKDWDSGLNTGFVFSYKYPAGPEWKVNIGDGVNRADLNVGGAIADNEWHTLSVSFDRDGLMKMYEDGIFIASTDIANIGDISTGEGLFFGADVNGAFPYSGNIAEVRVWNTILEDQTIEAWYCNSIDNTHPNFEGMLGYWKVNEGNSSMELIDQSMNNNPGSIQGANWDSSDSTLVYDYSNTPRLVDVPITALKHLCIPIDVNWGLEGMSLIPECVLVATEELASPPLDLEIQILPNPVRAQLNVQLPLRLSHKAFELEIYGYAGNKIHAQLMESPALSFDISSYPAGIYFVLVRMDDQLVIKRFVK